MVFDRSFKGQTHYSFLGPVSYTLNRLLVMGVVCPSLPRKSVFGVTSPPPFSLWPLFSHSTSKHSSP